MWLLPTKDSRVCKSVSIPILIDVNFRLILKSVIVLLAISLRVELNFCQKFGPLMVIALQCVSKKNTPDIFSCNLNKYFPIEIIFGTSIT